MQECEKTNRRAGDCPSNRGRNSARAESLLSEARTPDFEPPGICRKIREVRARPPRTFGRFSGCGSAW
jgi:hypothetical protein